MRDEKPTYSTVGSIVFLGSTSKALKIKHANGECWIARSCLHVDTDRRVDKYGRGEIVPLTIMDWVIAKESIESIESSQSSANTTGGGGGGDPIKTMLIDAAARLEAVAAKLREAAK